MYVNIVDKHLHITCAYDGMKYHEILFFTNTRDIFIFKTIFIFCNYIYKVACSLSLLFHTYNGNNHLCSCNLLIVGKQMTVQE